MIPGAETHFLTVTRLTQIPFLVHGFGTKEWQERDLKKYSERKHFRRIFLEQVHSDRIHRIDRMPEKKLTGDALATVRPHFFLVIRTADCLPVLIVDEERRVIAAVHCGWRGTQKRILERVITELQSRYGCQPSSLLVALGPGIGPDCYEVGGEVRQSFKEADLPEDVFRPHPCHPGKFLLDLREANLKQMRHKEIHEDNIFLSPICTHCDGNFPSFRREGMKAGRMLSFIGLSV
ncbi:MAG: peptidoglycan editing factor PgeF [Candidatus Aminicenantales bacterium]